MCFPVLLNLRLIPDLYSALDISFLGTLSYACFSKAKWGSDCKEIAERHSMCSVFFPDYS